MMPQCGAAGSSWPYNNHGKTYPSRVSTFTGIYSQANGLSTKITTMTKATCAEGSLDEQYIQLLSIVSAGGPDGAGHLALETAGGAKRMLFQNGGRAQ